jgi:hypothetical protein
VRDASRDHLREENVSQAQAQRRKERPLETR